MYTFTYSNTYIYVCNRVQVYSFACKRANATRRYIGYICKYIYAYIYLYMYEYIYAKVQTPRVRPSLREPHL